jgi:predicted aconitase
MGVSEEIVQFYKKSEAPAAGLGVQIMNTCTPYQVGNIPTRGEHCAWMESSAVVYCNSVLGARTNTEGRESTGAAMLTGRIPYWGFHRDENRRGTLCVELDIEVESVQDWGLLGYYIGELGAGARAGGAQPRGIGRVPNLPRLKHFGAAASSSGGVEMYHIAGVTPEALTLEQALGGNRARRGAALRRGRAPRDLREDQRQRQGPQGRST